MTNKPHRPPKTPITKIPTGKDRPQLPPNIDPGRAQPDPALASLVEIAQQQQELIDFLLGHLNPDIHPGYKNQIRASNQRIKAKLQQLQGLIK